MDKCPCCGEIEIVEHDESGILFRCGTFKGKTSVMQGAFDCKDRQLAAQADLIRRAVEVVRVIKNGELYVTRNSKGEFMFFSLRFADDGDELLILSKAQALLPDLEKAQEKVK